MPYAKRIAVSGTRNVEVYLGANVTQLPPFVDVLLGGGRLLVHLSNNQAVASATPNNAVTIQGQVQYTVPGTDAAVLVDGCGVRRIVGCVVTDAAGRNVCRVTPVRGAERVGTASLCSSWR